MSSVKIILASLYVIALQSSRQKLIRGSSKIKTLPGTTTDYVTVSKTINALQPADPIAIITNVNHRLDCLLACKMHSLCVSTSYIPDGKFCLLSQSALRVRQPLVLGQNSNPLVSYYNELIYQDDFGFPSPKTKLLDHGQAPPLCSLNMNGDNFLKHRRKRIVDGRTPEPYQVPWVGLLVKDGKARCTAFIISRNIADKSSFWVLSANIASSTWTTRKIKISLQTTNTYDFVYRIDLKPFGVLFGVHDLRVFTQQIVYRTIAAIHLHPDDGIKPKDLALIKLTRPIKFNSYINGLCFPDPVEEVVLYDESACATCGFGATAIDQKQVIGSDVLQCIDVFVHQPDYDHNLQSDWNSVVRLKAAGFGPYHGDSGSPIFCHSGDPWSFLFAVVTGGQYLTFKNAYLTAARISYFIKFINQNTIDYSDVCCPS